MRTIICLVALALSLGLVRSASTSKDEAADLRTRARAALSATEGEIRVSGLEQPVEVIRDRWGVPHIYAKTVADLFFAQGLVAAQDRLWQLDLWRRIAEGKLAEILGPSALNRDTFARLLRYRGDMDAEWRSYAPDAKAIIGAFVRGVNAQIAIATADPSKLPLEFQLTGSRPEPWTPEVVIGRMAGYVMTRNARTEVQRATLARSVGAARVPELMPLDPPTVVTVPDGLDLGDIDDEILALAAGTSESIDFSPLAKETLDPEAPLVGWARPAAPAVAAPFGSNDWVVSGRLSASGKPLLANDPHRTLIVPSLRYTVHLNGPGWNVIGAGEPALPGVAAGHNDRIAFGFTIVGIDQQDLYVERLDPSGADRYLYRGAWEPMRVERERINVRGEGPREIELRFTRHGPVLHVNRARHRAYALRWVGSEPGAAGYLRSLAIDTARNWQEFQAALDGWKVPSENLVYADVDGNIGWVAAGLAPIRPNWNGLLPVPGQDGKYEWSGFLRARELPHLFNPKSGFIATANHNVLPDGYPHALGYEFSAPYRFARILEVLGEGARVGRPFTVADFERLQHDELSVVARAVCGALRQAVAALPGRGAGASVPSDAGRAARMLSEWDGVLGADSAAAALYEIWLPKLTGAFAEALVPAADRSRAGAALSTDRLLALLVDAGLLADSPALVRSWVDGSCLPRKDSGRQRAAHPATRHMALRLLTGSTLADAWQEATVRMGPDPKQWAWGTIHHASLEHPLAFTPARKQVLNLPEVPRGGDGTTPNATGNGPRQTSGASYREVIDIADWDRSMTINVPGLSGQPESAHYGDLLPLWAAGQYYPMAFSRAAVEQYAASKMTLVPASRSH